MDRRQRVVLLTEAGRLDREHGTPSAANAPASPIGITRVRLPGGGATSLMRVMQTNACSLTCGYCPTYCGGAVRRTSLAPEEIATTFAEAHARGLAQGLFLTSGVPGRAHRAMDRMLATLELLRRREGFRGYVHIKLLPGIERAQVEAASALANRVSINLEAPTAAYVRKLAREKDLEGDLLPTLELAGRLSLERQREPRVDGPAPAGTSTQFVVGAAGEHDREILAVVARLESQRLLHHAHFSSFQPVVGTPMEGAPATPPSRELRLYQAEHLLRQYGFAFDEIPFEPDGNLALERDPKTTWALAHPEAFPLEITAAPYEMLLRVPGIGPRSARTLVKERRRAVLRGLLDLRQLGIDTVRAASFIALRGRRLASRPAPEQLRLFSPGGHLTQAPFNTVVPPCAYR
jgi:predicted DNA-binding helix-hairpin-helix protein